MRRIAISDAVSSLDPRAVPIVTISTTNLRVVVALPVGADGVSVDLRIHAASIIRPIPTTSIDPALLLHAIQHHLPPSLECEERTIAQTRSDLVGIVEDSLALFVEDILDPLPQILIEIETAADMDAVHDGILAMAQPTPVF